MIGVLVVNVAVTTWERHWARLLGSEILRADSQHTLSDVLVTIGVIAGLPLTPPEGIPGNTANVGVAEMPDVRVAIQTWVWWSNLARTMFFTYDIIFGATLLDESAGLIIKSA
jgi:hypothetical protein